VKQTKRTKEEKAAVGALLLAADRALSKLRKLARAAFVDAAAARTEAEHLSGLVSVGRRVSGEFSDALVEGRAEARAAARRRLKAELSSSGEVASFSTPAQAAASAAREAGDAARAEIAGDSLGTQWRAAEASARGELVSRKTAERAFDARLERTARTEAARAYNDEHLEAVREVARRDPELGARLMREWSAMADACPRCSPHDGERVGIDEDFEGGDRPGDMHPHCQCVEYVVAA
jgi:hypothetical protein